MPKLNKSKAITAALNRNRRVRSSSRKVCSAADSPVKESSDVDSVAFSGSVITSLGDRLRAGGAGRGIGFEIHGLQEWIDRGVVFAVFQRVVEQSLREVQVSAVFDELGLVAPEVAGGERKADHLHSRGYRADKQHYYQHCREGIISHR